MMGTKDNITTTSAYFIQHFTELLPQSKIEDLTKVIYIENQNPYKEITGLDLENEYIFKENIILTNHLDLFGKDAVDFDNTITGINKRNDVMSKLVKEIYEDRIFEF